METSVNLKAKLPLQELPEREMRELLHQHYVGSLAYISQHHPFVIPVTFFYDEPGNCLIAYSMEGHKIEAMRANPEVSLMIYQLDNLTRWKSVMIQGRFEELHQIDAKAYLHRFTEGIRKHIAPNNARAKVFIEDFSSSLSSEGTPLVYRINIDGWSGRTRVA